MQEPPTRWQTGGQGGALTAALARPSYTQHRLSGYTEATEHVFVKGTHG